MAETPSNMLPLGTIAPDFELLNVIDGKTVSLKSIQSKIATVVMFICNHCPYVIHIQSKLAEIAAIYKNKGVQFVAISSNDIKNYPHDDQNHMKKQAETVGFTFPYLYDETQQVARAYQAACTPDFYIFDKNLACVYRGRFDNSTPGNQQPVTGKDLTHALDNLLADRPINPEQLPSVGCNIKWKK